MSFNKMKQFAASQVNSDNAELVGSLQTPSGDGVFSFVDDTHAFEVRVSESCALEGYHAVPLPNSPEVPLLSMDEAEWMEILPFERVEELNVLMAEEGDIFSPFQVSNSFGLE